MNTPPRFTRRQILALSVLAVGGACGLCSVGGLAAYLVERRAILANLANSGNSVGGPTPIPPTSTINASATPAFTLASRVAWGARQPNHDAANEKGYASDTNPNGWYVYPGDLTAIYHTVAVHHSYPILRDVGTMRDIQNLHMDVQKWADVGYHFGIDGHGLVYEGRELTVRGSSVAGHNTGTVGVVLIGDFQQETPAPAQLDSLVKLIAWLRLRFKLTHLAGHSDFNPETVCPGPNLRSHLDDLARQAGLTRGTGGYIPPQTLSQTLTPGGKASCC